MHIFSELQLKYNKVSVFKVLNVIVFGIHTQHETISTVKTLNFYITSNSFFMPLYNPSFLPPHPQATRALLSVTINLFPFLRILH